MVRVLLMLLWLATVQAMDGGFSRPSGSDHRDPPLPFKFFPGKHMVYVGGAGFGKSGFLIMLLLWLTSAFCFRKIFKEVVIISLQLRAGLSVKDSSNWCYFRWLYQIDDETDESPDGFWRVLSNFLATTVHTIR